MTETSFTSFWQTRNTRERFPPLWMLSPPLIELEVNWPFPQLQQWVNEILCSVYKSSVFIFSLLPSLTLKVFCRMSRSTEDGRRGRQTVRANCVWMWYENTQFNHQSCIFISWHLLTFCSFPFIPAFIMQQIDTVNIEKTKKKWKSNIFMGFY